MKSRNLTPILLVSAILCACNGQNNSTSDKNEYKNPLNDYEKILVKKSALENLLNVSSIESFSKTSSDNEKLYGESTSRAISKVEENISKTTAIYTDKIILNNSTVTSSNTSNGIKITNSYEEKDMIAVLENPESVVKDSTSISKYGLYEKTYHKSSSAKQFGVTYSLLELNFANEDNLDYKWNNYLLNSIDQISSTSFNYFRNDDGDISALFSSLTKTSVTNPIYTYDPTKNVTTITSNVSSLDLDKIDDGYRLKEYKTSNDVDYLSDYFGNSLESGNVSHHEQTNSYFYGQTIFAGARFEASEYWELNSHTPVLQISNGEAGVDQLTFSNVTRDYQQTYGTDNYAFELTFKPSKTTTSYSLTDISKENVYKPNKFSVSSSVKLNINTDMTFSFEQANISYQILVVLDTKFNLKSVTVSLA